MLEALKALLILRYQTIFEGFVKEPSPTNLAFYWHKHKQNEIKILEK